MSRQYLLDAAESVFAARGYDGTRMQDIAADSGLALATVYDLISSKEELYAEVDEVLRRHPNLRVIFAHFYFLSADLPRAARFFDAHPEAAG